MAETKVAVEVDVSGLEQAMAKFERFSGSASSVQRAMGQFERLGEKGMASGGDLSPADYDKMGRALENIKRTETEITKQIQDRRVALAAIDSQMEKIFSKRTPAVGVYEGMIARGFTPDAALRRALANDLPGSGDLAGLRILEPQARRLHDEIGRLERDQGRIGGSLPHAEAAFDKITQELPRNLDRTFQRFTSQLGRVFLMGGMSAVGMGSALGIAAQARSRAIQYDPRAADISAFIGSSANARERGLRGAGDFGLYPMEALDLVESIGAAGGPVNDRMIARMAGMGLHFGLGRTGFGHMARESVGRGTFANFGDFNRFGTTAGALAQDYGLTPGQRAFFLESNKNFIEQQSRWYGGRPLTSESYFGGIHTLMAAMRDLGLPMGGAPIAADTLNSISKALTPVGKSFPDLLTEAALLGVQPVPGMGQYLGTQRAINEMMRSPSGFTTALQNIARNAGVSTGPGAQIGGDQLDAFMGLISNKFPSMLQPLGALNTSGVNVADLLRMQPPALPADLEGKMQGILDATKKAADEGWRREDINYNVKGIENLGTLLKKIDETVKGLGPIAGAGLSTAGSLLPYAFSYFGTRHALTRLGVGAAGATLGGAGLGLGALGLGVGALGYMALTSGEEMGTRPPKSKWRGNRQLTKEEFAELSEMGRRGQLDLSDAPRAERPPIGGETLVDAIVGAFNGLMIKIGELSTVLEDEKRKALGVTVIPEKRSYDTLKPRGNR